MTKTYNLENFTPTQHFLDRAKERFGIETSEQLHQFIKDNNIVTDSGLTPTSNRESTLSRHGNMFIIDPKTQSIITVYKSITPVIAERKRMQFQDKLNTIIRESQVSTAKDYLSEIRDNFQRLYFNAMELINTPEQSLFSQIENPETEFSKIEQIYKDVTVIKTTLNLLSKQTNFYEQHKTDYTPEIQIEEPQQWTPSQTLSLDDFKDSQYEVNTVELGEVDKFGTYSPQYDLFHDDSLIPAEPPFAVYTPEEPKESNLPTDYKPKVSNNELLTDKLILNEYFDGSDRMVINNWFSKQGKSPLGSKVNKAIKAGYTQTQLESLVKSKLSIIHFNKFKNVLKDTLKDAKKRKGN